MRRSNSSTAAGSVAIELFPQVDLVDADEVVLAQILYYE